MLTIKRRRTFSFAGVFYSVYKGEGHPDNVPMNLTGGTARAQIREKKRGKGRKEAKIVANLNPVFPSPTTGVILINHDRDFTTALQDRSPDEIEWDLIFTDAAGTDYTLVPPQPVFICTPPTNPEDDSSDDFVPGGGGHLFHTHPISQIQGLQAIIDDLMAAMLGAMDPVPLIGPVTYVPQPGEYFFKVDAALGNVVLELPPPADRVGKPPIIVKRIDDSGIHTATIEGTIDGAPNFSLNNENGAVGFRADAVEGYLITTGYLLE